MNSWALLYRTKQERQGLFGLRKVVNGKEEEIEQCELRRSVTIGVICNVEEES